MTPTFMDYGASSFKQIHEVTHIYRTCTNIHFPHNAYFPKAIFIINDDFRGVQASKAIALLLLLWKHIKTFTYMHSMIMYYTQLCHLNLAQFSYLDLVFLYFSKITLLCL